VANTLNEKIKKLGTTRRRKIEARADQLIAEEMSLRELRQAHKYTQENIAKALDIGQDGVSRLEKRTDLLLSTLRSYVEAMGGSLSIVAEFPNRQRILISGLTDIDVRQPSEQKEEAAYC
jgi:transcriptional regulator with XRE-family HTH domain